MARSEAEKVLGVPSQSRNSGGFEIVTYQAEQIGDDVYGIRVAYSDGVVSQCYLYFEQCETARVGKTSSRLSERLQLALVVLLAAIGLAVYFWLRGR